VAVIPAGHFDNLIAVTSAIENLTGVNGRYHKIPSRQIRQGARGGGARAENAEVDYPLVTRRASAGRSSVA
jgi:hypothetical protein